MIITHQSYNNNGNVFTFKQRQLTPAGGRNRCCIQTLTYYMSNGLLD